MLFLVKNDDNSFDKRKILLKNICNTKKLCIYIECLCSFFLKIYDKFNICREIQK